MLSKNQLKLITSLHQKKYRNKHGLFLAEGEKIVAEFLKSSLEVSSVYCTEDLKSDILDSDPIFISEKELQKISQLKTPNKVLGVFRIPPENNVIKQGVIIVLDGIKDPGNLGTIIRLCDWFGIQQLVCSKDTVDCYNSKVVQASMGSLTRVSISYQELAPFLSTIKLPIFGALLEGENVYKTNLPKDAVLVIGNESHGISDAVIDEISHKITIPRFGELQQTESLNAATATSILLSEFSRNVFTER